MTYQNQIDRERILRNRHEVLQFARRADYAFEHRDESKQKANEAKAAREAATRRRLRENQAEQHALNRLRQIAGLPGVEPEKIHECRLAEQAFAAAERRREKEDRDERWALTSVLAWAQSGEDAAEELQKLWVQDREIFDRGAPPRLKAEFRDGAAVAPTAVPAVRRRKVPPPTKEQRRAAELALEAAALKRKPVMV